MLGSLMMEKRIESDGPGEVKLKLEWNDDPKKYGVAVDKIEVGGVVLDQRGKRGSDTKTLVIQGAPNPSTSSNQSQQLKLFLILLILLAKQIESCGEQMFIIGVDS